MKRLFLAALLVGAALPALAADYTDMWYNPSQPGYGYAMTQSDDGTGHPFLFVPFFIYGQSNQPTWYVAGLTWNGTDKFTGNVYAATGTFFGAPWNPANYVATQVGTATFTPNAGNNYQGTFAYTATNVGSATVPLERQTLTANATGGSYSAVMVGGYTGCSTPDDNYQYVAYPDLVITHSAGGNVTYAFDFGGLTCNLTGTYVQHGQYFEIPNAAYTCSDGLATTAKMYEIKATALGIEGRLAAPSVANGCAEYANFSAVLNL